MSVKKADYVTGAAATTDDECGVGLSLRLGPLQSADPRQRRLVVLVDCVLWGGGAAARGVVQAGDVLLSIREAGTGQVGALAPTPPRRQPHSPPLPSALL